MKPSVDWGFSILFLEAVIYMNSNIEESFYKDVAKTLISEVLAHDCESGSARDFSFFETSLEQEGIEFLTQTLPSLGKAFDKALATDGQLIVPELFGSGPIPCFLSERFQLFFDATGNLFSYLMDGAPSLLPEDLAVLKQSCREIRQVCYLWYKLELPYDKKTSEEVLASFVETDQSLPEIGKDNPSHFIIMEARKVISRLLAGFTAVDIQPRHGPGAVATGEKGPSKAYFSHMYRSLEAEYPFYEYFVSGANGLCDDYHLWDMGLTLEDEPTAKVVLVPKDSRGPRLISCEPLAIQWIQQGIMNPLVKLLERHWLTKGHVNFTCQRVNRRLALEASAGANWYTLDLKDASDRVSLSLVERLFSGCECYRKLIASRSTCTRLPNGNVVRLKKYAPMGSALCFPVEALVFFVLAICSICKDLGLKLSQAREWVYVYGDDIILHPLAKECVVRHFSNVGLLFNAAKCCTGRIRFRESCGCDAFQGADVTPVRFRIRWCRSNKDANALASWVSYANSIGCLGYVKTARLIQKYVELLFGELPFLSDASLTCNLSTIGEIVQEKRTSLLGWSPSSLGITKSARELNRLRRLRYRFSRKVHRAEVFGPTIQARHSKVTWEGWAELLRRTSQGSSEKIPGVFTVPRRCFVKWTWGAE